MRTVFDEYIVMKLGVSTLGCPQWTLEEILERLPAYGYDGVELRGLGPDLNLTQSPAFATTAARERSARLIADAGLEIVALDSSASFADTDSEARSRNQAMARADIDLAAVLNAPHVRVFGGSFSDDMPRVEAVALVAESLRTLGDYAAQVSDHISVVLETHDSFSTGSQAAEVLALVDHPQVGVLWDLHHPFRQGEMPEVTNAALHPYVRLTHVKDSIPGGSYCLLGEGDIPILEMMHLLQSDGYIGYLSVEWEKRWIPMLLDPEIAFPQYARQLRDYLAELESSLSPRES